MRILFQGIGVLVQYNWGLPYYASIRGKIKIVNLTNVFSYIMGGHYYHSKAPQSLVPVFTGLGVSRFLFLDDYMENLLNLGKFAKKFNIIHLNRPDGTMTDKLLRTSIPKIFVFHGSLDVIDERRTSITCQRLETIYSKVDAFVTASNHAAETVNALCGFKPIVIRHGVDTSIFNPYYISRENARRKLSIQRDKKVILWVGRIDPIKNLSMIINMLPNIVREQKNVLLLVKGRAVDKSYLRRILTSIKNTGLTKYVRLDLRWSTNMDMIYYYRAADVYVHTSLSEAFGSLTMLEAMASGIPVVAYKSSSIPEALGDAGLLGESEQDLTEKILKVLNDDNLKSLLSRKSRERIIHQKLDLESVAERYLALYDFIAK